jgi:hypothetical protein
MDGTLLNETSLISLVFVDWDGMKPIIFLMSAFFTTLNDSLLAFGRIVCPSNSGTARSDRQSARSAPIRHKSCRLRHRLRPPCAR